MRSVRIVLWVIAAASFVALTVWLRAHWNDLDAVALVVGSYPFWLAMLLELVPLKEMRFPHRALIFTVGVGFTYLQWHQQALESAADEQDRAEVVHSTNEHTDLRVGELKTGIDERLDSVASQIDATQRRIADLIEESAPKASPPALLRFQLPPFLRAGSTQSASVKRELDSTVRVQIALSNISEITADRPSIWVRICDSCTFATEPEGLSHVEGAHERVRNRAYPGDLLPHVSFPPITLHINAPNGARAMKIGTKHACKNCSAESVDKWQKLDVVIE
jgi:hypothetical protein